ncbi:MAG: hypothetical protein AAGA09_03370 [Pseudomonadota bacterium]
MFQRRKTAVLTAASAIASVAALGIAHSADGSEVTAAAGPFGPAFAATEAVRTPIGDDAATTDEAASAAKTSTAAKRFALLAVAAGALAGIVKLLGARKIAKTVGDSAVRVGKAASSAAGGAAEAVGAVVKSPLRRLGLLLGLAVFALTGIGIYELEWLGGLAAGFAIAVVGATGLGRLKRLQLKPVRIRKTKH